MPWLTKKLTDLLENCDAGVWGKLAVKGKGLFVLRSTNMNNDGHLDFSDVAERKVEGNIEKWKLSDGDILVEKSGGGPDQPVGRVAYFIAPNPRDFAFANFIQRLRAKPDLINSRFLFYRLLFLHKISFTKKLQSQTTGIRNLKLSLYLKTEIPLPPLQIQKQIVERLDKIAEAQKLNDELIQKTDELFQSLLHSLIRANSGIAKKLEDVIDINYGKGLEKSERVDDGKYHAYGSNGPIYKTNKALVVSPTIVIGRKGGAGLLYLTNEPSWPIDTAFYVLVKDEKQADLEFVYYMLQTKKLPKLAITTAVPGVNRNDLYRIKISLPPLKTQKQIVTKLSAVQNYKKQLLEQKTKLKELFDSALAKSMKN